MSCEKLNRGRCGFGKNCDDCPNDTRKIIKSLTPGPTTTIVGNMSLHDLLTAQNKAREALEYLLQVKAHKDTVGKDDWYKLNQPLAWEEAERAVEFLKKECKYHD